MKTIEEIAKEIVRTDDSGDPTGIKSCEYFVSLGIKEGLKIAINISEDCEKKCFGAYSVREFCQQILSTGEVPEK